MKSKTAASLAQTHTALALWVHSLLSNLRAGVRAAFFVPVAKRSWTISPEQLLAIVALTVVLSIGMGRTFYSGDVSFNWSGLRAVLFSVPIVLLFGWLASRFATRRVNTLAVPVALFSALVTMSIVTVVTFHVVLRTMPERSYQIWGWLYLGYYVWFAVVAAVLARRLAGLAARHAPLALLPIVLMCVFSLYVPARPFWHQAPAEESSGEQAGDSPVMEEILHLQPKLTEGAIRGLERHRAGVADMYFVAFAPYAYEDVFLKESTVIRQLMDDRFDTQGRSLLLVNNDKTLRQHPLATVTNLRAALDRIGRLMNKEEDVLLLYLTSHGSKSHELAAEYWPLVLQELDPSLVRQLLDEAGIKWRIVIVSACYSGGFVEPLHGPTTLVMTAADATHTSFGCGAGSDFTYFAKALFDEQLRETYSFKEAFVRAIPVIRERERTAKAEFSNPQLAMGEDIRIKLAELERRWAARSAMHSAENRQAELPQ